MEFVIKSFKLVVHEILGYVILNCKRKENILLAYASQKYTNKRNNDNIFYIAQEIKKLYSTTERNLLNYLIIHFKTLLIPMNILDCIKKIY